MSLFVGGPKDGERIDTQLNRVVVAEYESKGSLIPEYYDTKLVQYFYNRMKFHSNGRVHYVYIEESLCDDPMGALIEGYQK
jgi:hypothetical protein